MGAGGSTQTQKEMMKLDKNLSMMKRELEHMQAEFKKSEDQWQKKSREDAAKINILEKKVHSARITAKKAKRAAKRLGPATAAALPPVSTPATKAASYEVKDDEYDEFPNEEKMEAGMTDDLFECEEADAGEQFGAVKPWLGAVVEPSNPPNVDITPPAENLILDWIHGYRGYDSRSNIILNSSGEIVYPVASIIVTFNLHHHTQRFFKGHNHDVLSIAQNPKDLDIIASGQQAAVVAGRKMKPYICVHNSTSGEEIMRIKNAGEGFILNLAFSYCGKYLVSSEMDQKRSITVWDWKAGKKLDSQPTGANMINQICWNHKNPNELITVGQKHSSYWKFNGKNFDRPKRGNQRENFNCVCYSRKGNTVLGADDGNLYYMFEQNGSIKCKSFGDIHKPKAKIQVIIAHEDGLVSGATDGSLVFLDSRVKPQHKIQFPAPVKAIVIKDDLLVVGLQNSQIWEVPDYQERTNVEGLAPSIMGHYDGELWGLDVNPRGTGEYATAGEDNTLNIWSVKDQRQVRATTINPKRGAKKGKKRGASSTTKFPPNQCARSVAYSPDGAHLAVGTNSGELRVFDSKTMELVTSKDLNKLSKRKVTNQKENWIEMIKFSPSGRTLAVATHGIVVVLLSVEDGYKPVQKLKDHNASVTALDWSTDGTSLKSVCMAYELLYFDIDEDNLKNSKQQTSAKLMKDVEWAAQSTKFGWHVDGIFVLEDGHEVEDGSFVNCVARDSSSRLCATGDDNMNVNLFRYPVQKGGKCKSFSGHASHVTRLSFFEDKYVLSTGGEDKSIFQWRIQ